MKLSKLTLSFRSLPDHIFFSSFSPPPTYSLVGPQERKPMPQFCIAFQRFHLHLPYSHHSHFLRLCKEIIVHISTALGIPNEDLSKTSFCQGHCKYLKQQCLRSGCIHITLQYCTQIILSPKKGNIPLIKGQLIEIQCSCASVWDQRSGLQRRGKSKSQSNSFTIIRLYMTACLSPSVPGTKAIKIA